VTVEGVAVTAVEVESPVTVTLAVPADAAMPVVPAYVAVMVSLSSGNAAPCTVSEQLPELSVQLPRLVLPCLKLTVPVGTTLDDEFATVAVMLVDAVAKMLVGLATTVVVETSCVSVTDVVPDELLNWLVTPP